MHEQHAAEQMSAEIARLRAQNRELRAHNQALQAQVRRLRRLGRGDRGDAGDRREAEQRRAWMEEVFATSGETGAIMRTIDWASTPVGPIKSWSLSMCMTLRLCLASHFPMLLLWGPEYIQFYNDAYIPILGAKHPRALGQDVASSWPEVWEKDGAYASVRTSGELTFYQNARYGDLQPSS